MAAEDREFTKARIASITTVATAAWMANRRGAPANPGSSHTQRSPVSGSLPDRSLRKIRL